MAMAAACCLSPSPPTPRSSNPSPSSSSSSTSSMAPRTIQVAWGRNEQAQPGRRSGAARAAMAVIGLVGMGSSLAGLGEITGAAMASESLETSAARQEGMAAATVARWSEKRSCPPWQLNSLETIVPENLPRPYGHRKSESVGLSDRRDAPALKARAAKSNPRCFSM